MIDDFWRTLACILVAYLSFIGGLVVITLMCGGM